MFTESFNNYVCPGDTITTEADGFTVTARIEFDYDFRIDDDDCHNPDPSVTGCNEYHQEQLLKARDAWFNDEWFYCGIVLSVSWNGIEVLDYAASLWGIECNYPGTDNSYLSELATELLDEAVEQGLKALDEMVDKLTA